MPFIDYSSTFNTMVPVKVMPELRVLGLNTTLCYWILELTFSALTLSTGDLSVPFCTPCSGMTDAQLQCRP
jgi:hypothetical protein